MTGTVGGMRVLAVVVLAVLLATATPAVAECAPADPERLLGDSQASFVGLLLSQADDTASFLVREVVTGPLEEGPLEVVVEGDPYEEGEDAMGYLLGRAGGEWTGDGCRVIGADELLALAPDRATGVSGGSHAEEPPYSLLLIPAGVIVVGVVVVRVRARDE